MNGFSPDGQVGIIFYDHVKVEGRHGKGFLLHIPVGNQEQIIGIIGVLGITVGPETEKINQPSIFFEPDVFIGYLPDQGKLLLPGIGFPVQEIKEAFQGFPVFPCSDPVIRVGRFLPITGTYVVAAQKDAEGPAYEKNRPASEEYADHDPYPITEKPRLTREYEERFTLWHGTLCPVII
jgi:hypothetical protein